MGLTLPVIVALAAVPSPMRSQLRERGSQHAHPRTPLGHGRDRERQG
jgi:hypothetical protein